MFVFINAGESFLYKYIRSSLLANMSLLYLLFRESVLIVMSNSSEREESTLSKADIVVIDMPLLDTRREKNLLGTFISDVVLALLSYVAENERTNIKQRQAEGIAAAKARGVKFGRPPLPIPENFYQMHKDWRAGKITIEEAAKACNMCPKTFYSKAVKYEKSS